MTTPAKPAIRCALYTRKSSEEGLDQSFNSLHAQREACESYGLPVFVKIDIEGSEIAVLASAAEFLKSHPTIHFTLDTSHVVNGELTRGAVEKTFQSCNYEVESSDQCGIMTTWARPAAISRAT